MPCIEIADRASTSTPFLVHCEDSAYSDCLIVPAGHHAHVRVFQLNDDRICGIGIEQAVTSKGRILSSKGTKCCPPRMYCRKTKHHWFPFKCVECFDYILMKCVKRPWLLTPHGDCEICLPCGRYRFVSYDENYDLIVPEEPDIIMQASIDTGPCPPEPTSCGTCH